ncbi:OmpP1/FadL family transporter [Microbulbifer celer]|uniref:OmpP1/FadL family transporter n=1 Tax=Microbulbifer celer TaxID=435905 RepID=A0ABW3UDC3_9GAMM|nr:outer membrane protein transport protein [Microbulbifer celer]UFN55810.1 outer membrane protein transport protein [Microbulbifer celer]
MNVARSSLRLLPLTVAVLVAPVSHAGGLMLWEIGTPTLGTAGAGWAATPEDAATAFTNPAGTVWRNQTQVRVAAQALYGDVGFTDDGQSNVSGNDGGNPIRWFPTAGAFAAGKITENIGWGMAMAGNFGLGLDYHDDWKGRRFVQNVDLIGMSLLPSLSWQVNDCLSVGIGLNAMSTYFSFQSAPRAGLIDEDAYLRYKDLDTGFGGNFGIIYRPVSGTTIGLSYTSEVDLEFKDRLKLRDFGPLFDRVVGQLDQTRTTIDMTVPQTVTASLQQELQPGTTLYANLAWQDWSEFAGVSLALDNPNQTSVFVNRGYRDTGHFALGLRQEFKRGFLQDWYLSTGIAYDSGMSDEVTMTADTVTNKAWQFGLGAGTELCPGLQLDFAYNLGWLGDVDIDQTGRPPFSPRLEGTYKDTALHFFGGSIQFGF